MMKVTTLIPTKYALILLYLAISSVAAESVKVVVGADAVKGNIGWTDGVCYSPIDNVLKGDLIEFNYGQNNVYKMASQKRYKDCDFNDAVLLATIDEDPYRYAITDEDVAEENIYFADKVGNNCIDGNQKIVVKVSNYRSIQPTSEYANDLSSDKCDTMNGSGEVVETMNWSDSATIVIGDDSGQFNIGWSDGVCYVPVDETYKGDTLEFNYGGHDVHKMASKDHFEKCNFTDAMLLATVGESPFKYTISDSDLLDESLYFACSIGSHCSGGKQKLTVDVKETRNLGSRKKPESKFIRSLSNDFCDIVQDGGEVSIGDARDNAKRSTCADPVLQDDGRFFVTCLSGPATLTPGGVVNNLYFMHYPYPTDRRVVVGERTWEFVSGDPIGDTIEGTTPVPVNQLYVHHLSGRVVLGQGTEGIRRSAPDAPYPYPYATLTGDEGDSMIFHIIDLREVDDWLPCIECRCKDSDGSYLDIGGDGGRTGGVDCCTNCTALSSPTIDYRMRYNVSWSDVEEEKPITPLLMLTADISPAADKIFEFDVPSYKYLPLSQQSKEYPQIQRLERTAPFDVLFKHEFFGADYYGPKTVKLFRCVAHLHVAAIRMWLEDADTGEILCDGVGGYGNDPSQDKGFLTSVTVSNYESDDEIKIFPSDRMVRFVTDYNATELHTGVMGMEFIFISSEETITPVDTKLNIDVCIPASCDISLLPPRPDEFAERMSESTEDTAPAEDSCVDTISESMGCSYGGLCDCEGFVNAKESTGCNGTYTSSWGDIEVNSLCANYCGCPPVKKNDCEDKIAENPACKFGGLCECETFVKSPESTGCGGIYTSGMGDIIINDLCPSYCNACPDTTAEEELAALYVEHLEDDMSSNCRYSTVECTRKLSNLAGCARGSLGFDNLHPIIQSAIMEHGDRVAMKYSKLGGRFLHMQDEDVNMGLCSDKNDQPDKKTVESGMNENVDEMSSAPCAINGMVVALLALIGVLGASL